MDIIVTTPKSQIKNAAAEAADCIADNGGTYFRRFNRKIDIDEGDKVWYVEDGYLRGFAIVSRFGNRNGQQCDTTGKDWSEGFYVYMDARSWKWIKPIPYKGFMGFRYAKFDKEPEVIGDWLMKKPEV